MAIAKIIFKESAEDAGTVWMDTTQKTVTAGSMLDGVTALKNDGTDITGSIASKTSSDLTASGATVTAPAGYYASSASKSVESGTEGTPTASKGTVSNHAVSVTPSVTNSAGYISGGTKTGTAVTVSASELVSGTKTISTSGTTDVTNYASASVAAGSAATPATTITANPSISVNSSTGLITATASATQSVTPTVSAGYVSAGTTGTITVSGSNTSQLSTQSAATITPTTSAQTAVAAGKYTLGAVTVGAIPSQYIVPSGTITITSSGTGIDVSQYATADVSIAQEKPYIKLYLNVANGETVTLKTNLSVSIYWGDGTTDTTTLNTTKTHTYSVGGTKVVTVTASGNAYIQLNQYCLAQSINTPNTSLISADLNDILFFGLDFAYCDNLETVTIKSIYNANTTAANQEFSGCTGLKNVHLDESVTKLMDLMFYGCTSITNIVIPSAVKEIGRNCFAGCTSLAEVHVLATTVPTLGSAYVFNNNASGRIIYVPYSADHSILQAYQTAQNWSNYASAIQEEPQ